MSTGGIMSGAGGVGGGGAPLLPTFHGYISSTMDALILFEACLSGRLSHVPRRPHDRERSELIASGNVFMYEEHSSGIRRWTDGVPWSPSRILGNFLLYRELDKPFQPGEKKRAMKRQRTDSMITKSSSHSRASSVGNYASAMIDGGASMSNLDSTASARNDAERALVGSLVDSYQFRPHGLIKKTISVTYNGIQHHLVSYYNIDDVIHNKLRTPTQDPNLRDVSPRAPLISSSSFRAPVDDNEVMYAEPHFRGVMNPSYNGFSMNGGSRSFSVPSMHTFDSVSWTGSSQYAPPYSAGPTLPPPVPPVSYTSASSYNYDHNATIPYGMAPRPPMPYPQVAIVPRRHSAMNGTNGNIDYSGLSHLDRTPMSTSQLIGNDGSLGGQNLPNQSSYANGSMFETSATVAAAAAAVASAPSSYHRDTYNNNSGNQNDGLYNNGVAMNTSSGIDGQVENGFDARAAHHASHDFSTSLPEPRGHNSVTTSQDDTSAAMQLGLGNADPTSNSMTDADWAAGFMPNESYEQDGQDDDNVEESPALQLALRRINIQDADRKLIN
ncbi:Gti1/Pac2 family-domain-containing protein [Daldinia vernicosa]|uniref:Gti1/Pac2 family-domain-containing protein n=1 Tax=Daldinia vernicosa TaxID=114800 RepID=UPI002008E24B|nr:Gti1/Pac2 family-domain-containing protein [Daldinia vernicosa]KAI0846315.1 Gti1/Pac2 family-domain-containing protein [Daldinia vernicosa]